MFKRIIATLLVFAGLLTFAVSCAQDVYKPDHFEVIAMNSSVAVSGSFFLGTGTVDGYPCFYGYFKNEQGEISLKQVLARDTRIIEEDRTDAYAEYYSWGKPNTNGVKYFIHVPNGTISHMLDFSLVNMK